jgi:hypothetical protein
MKIKRRRDIKRARYRRPAVRHWRGTELSITYQGLDRTKDIAIRKALGKYDLGSGFIVRGEGAGTRDHAATVPEDDLARVLAALKKIPGIRTKKCVVKWVLCR